MNANQQPNEDVTKGDAERQPWTEAGSKPGKPTKLKKNMAGMKKWPLSESARRRKMMPDV
jgi:hypothetical protein